MSDIHTTNNMWIAVHTFASRLLISFFGDEMLVQRSII